MFLPAASKAFPAFWIASGRFQGAGLLAKFLNPLVQRNFQVAAEGIELNPILRRQKPSEQKLNVIIQEDARPRSERM